MGVNVNIGEDVNAEHGNLIEDDWGFDAVYAYTCGNCWELGVYLHDLTGWPIYLVHEDYLEEIDEDTDIVNGVGCWHIVLQADDDVYVDVTGAMTMDEVTNRYWYAYNFTKVDRDHLWDSNAYREHIGHDITNSVARFIIMNLNEMGVTNVSI